MHGQQNIKKKKKVNVICPLPALVSTNLLWALLPPTNQPMSYLCSKCPRFMSLSVQLKLEWGDKILVNHATT